MRFTLKVAGRHHDVALGREGDRFKIDVDGQILEVEVARGKDATRVLVAGRAYELKVEPGSVAVDGRSYPVDLSNLETGDAPGHHKAGSHGRVKPPMPGKVVAVRVKVGDHVKPGQTLLVLEAMKMQNEIATTVEGVVKEVKCQPGQAVETKDVLVVIE